MNLSFGPLHGHLPGTPTPVGTPCFYCEEAIAESDSGTIIGVITAEGSQLRAAHRECEIRQVIGSLGHQRGLCSCNGRAGTLDDPPGVSKRVAALLAEREFLLTMRGVHPVVVASRTSWRCHCGAWNHAACRACGRGPDERFASGPELDALGAPEEKIR